MPPQRTALSQTTAISELDGHAGGGAQIFDSPQDERLRFNPDYLTGFVAPHCRLLCRGFM